VCAFVTLLGLVLAAEARAEDGSAASGDVASPVELASGGAQTDEQPATPEQPTAEPPATPEQPTAEPPATPEQPTAEPPATPEQPTAEPPATPEQPTTEPPSPEPLPPVTETPPPPAPPARADTPVVESPLRPEAPAVTTLAGDVAPDPPLPAVGRAPAEVETALGSRRESTVTVPRDKSPPRLPSLFQSPGGSDQLATQSRSRSEIRNVGSHSAGSSHNAPRLPALPFRSRAPFELYVSAGGMGSGSSGGFFPLVLAGLVALFAAAAQRLGGLVPFTRAPPRCAAFLLCLERPD
jgi:outer membrane biosynthesis protein TonB